MNAEAARPIEILLVEDNEADVYLTRSAFKKAKLINNIEVAMDGEIAVNRLFKRGEFADVKTPDLILLDINLPKKNGLEVLEEIKNDDALRRIPVIMLTGSQAERDVLKTYDLHANSFIVKPIGTDVFYNVVSAIEQFWFGVVVLPPK